LAELVVQKYLPSFPYWDVVSTIGDKSETKMPQYLDSHL